MATVLVIPDLHAPWMHPGAVDFLSDLRRQYKPDQVLCLGDEADCHRWSRHPQSPELPGPADEILQARKSLAPLFKLFPRVKVCESNHGVRPYRRAQEAGIPEAFLLQMRSVLGAPKSWWWEFSFDIDNVHYRHGDGFSGRNAAITAAEKVRRSVVIGHIHSFAGIQYTSGVFDSLFGFNCGCLIDADSPAFAYGRHLAQKPTLGAGVVIDGVPFFLPMPHQKLAGESHPQRSTP